MYMHMYICMCAYVQFHVYVHIWHMKKRKYSIKSIYKMCKPVKLSEFYAE